MGDLRLDGVSFSGYGHGTLMLGGVNYTRSGGGSGSMTSLDAGVPRSAFNTQWELNDSVTNYDLILIMSQYICGSGNPFVGSALIPSEIITNGFGMYVIGGNMDRMVYVQFVDDTHYQILNSRGTNTDAVGAIYGIKL